MDNLPDDWNTYYTRCEVCGGRRHASGVEECACDPEAEAEAVRLAEDEAERRADAMIEAEIERREEER